MDRIAATGVRFEKAYCATPVCVPSRTSMMTGRIPHELGVTYNLDRYDVLAPSLGRVMKSAGYRTGYVGKWHIPMSSENASWHGFDLMAESFKAHNDIPGEEFNDTQLVDPAIRFINDSGNAPFFLVVSFTNPHDICEWARRHTGGFQPARMELKNGEKALAPAPTDCPPLPANFAIPELEPDCIRKYQKSDRGTYPVLTWGENDWRQYRWALNRLTEATDTHIGRILDALRDSGQEKTTLIIFLSDHGDGNGAHHWNQKSLLYEESARVPFILSQTGTTLAHGVNHDHLVNTGTDLFATVCDAGGVDYDQSRIGGCSAFPAATGRRVSNPPAAVVCETDLAGVYGLSGGVFGRMYRTQRYKYTVFSEGSIREQLFDLEEDPGEMRSLIHSDAHRDVLNTHRQGLADWCRQKGDFFVVPETLRDGWSLRSS